MVPQYSKSDVIKRLLFNKLINCEMVYKIAKVLYDTITTSRHAINEKQNRYRSDKKV